MGKGGQVKYDKNLNGRNDPTTSWYRINHNINFGQVPAAKCGLRIRLFLSGDCSR